MNIERCFSTPTVTFLRDNVSHALEKPPNSIVRVAIVTLLILVATILLNRTLCLYGNGRKVHYLGAIEEGEFLLGVLHGQGKRILPNQIVLEGEFDRGYLDVLKKRTWPDDTVEEGEFEELYNVWRLCGKGQITRPDGTVVEGIFKNGRLSKEATITYPDGKVWDGNGQGKIPYPDGTEEGEFKDGKLSGSGKKTWANGLIEEGKFFDSLMDGKRTWPDGTVDKGLFWLRRSDWEGMRTKPNGTVEEGCFKERSPKIKEGVPPGELHGPGKRTNPSGLVLVGDFDYGCFPDEEELEHMHTSDL